MGIVDRNIKINFKIYQERDGSKFNLLPSEFNSTEIVVIPPKGTIRIVAFGGITEI